MSEQNYSFPSHLILNFYILGSFIAFNRLNSYVTTSCNFYTKSPSGRYNKTATATELRAEKAVYNIRALQACGTDKPLYKQNFTWL